MIVDARTLPDRHRIVADVCVIGAGAAGITLAYELRDSGLKVVLLEAGGRGYAAESQGFYRGEVADGAAAVHPPAEMYRQRRFGGTTTVWGGRCVPLEDIDFESRDYVPDSGWPITGADLEPHYRRAQELCEAGRYAYTVAEALPPGAPREMIPGFVSDIVTTDRIERYSPPTDFGRRFGRALRRARNVEVYLHAPCVELLPAHDGRSLVAARCVTTSAGKRLSVQARRFVVAAGGLETPRLLLASNSVHAAGIGNHAGHVGRYYMCHLEGTLGVLDLRQAKGPVVIDFERTARRRVYARRRLGLSPEAQRRYRLLNFVARLFHESIVDPSHGDGVLSSMFLVKDLLLPEYSRKLTTPELSRLAAAKRDARFLLRHLVNIVRDAPRLAVFGVSWCVRRNLVRRKIPYVVLANRGHRYPLDFNAEQSPDPDSRVSLGNERDPLGLPKLRIDWRVNESDFDSIERTYRLMQREFVRSGVGTLEFDSDRLRDQVRGAHPIGGHHIGTTRMGATPADGVVDRDGKVFHIENLFIAGSAVFRTSGYANPTLTIVAMAVRLAEHLRRVSAYG